MRWIFGVVVVLFSVLFLMSQCANAATGDTYVIVHGPTVHHEVNPPNDNTFGLGLRHDFSDVLDGQIGFYRNSFNRRSYYGIVDATAVREGRFSAGVWGGFASGYERWQKAGGSAAAGVFGRWEQGRASLTVRSIPLKRGFTSVEFGWKF